MDTGSPQVNTDVFISTPTGTGVIASWSPAMHVASPTAPWNFPDHHYQGDGHSLSYPRSSEVGINTMSRPSSVMVTGVDDSNARLLEYNLGNNPLAVKLAGAYIATTIGSIPTYLALYHEKLGSIRLRLNGYDMPYAAAALEISFETLERDHEQAADLLLTCSFLHNENIYDDFIRRGLAQDGKLLTSNPYL